MIKCETEGCLEIPMLVLEIERIPDIHSLLIEKDISLILLALDYANTN